MNYPKTIFPFVSPQSPHLENRIEKYVREQSENMNVISTHFDKKKEEIYLILCKIVKIIHIIFFHNLRFFKQSLCL